MVKNIGTLVVLALLASPAWASAQDPAPAAPDRPRVEVGVGGGAFFGSGTMPDTSGTLDARAGVMLSRNWSLEGIVLFMPSGGPGIRGYYRAQALWRLGHGGARPFIAFGGAGEFARYSFPEYRYSDYYTGESRVIPAHTSFTIDAPWYPTASLGVEKILAPHLAVRAELTAGFGINDYGIAVALIPGVSVSIPIGRYRTSR